jgi:hypothetical protein
VATLDPVDETFFDSAPARYAHTWTVRRPAEQVWSELTSDRPLSWVRAVSLRWTSARPFGVGTTRQAKVLGGVLSLAEHFFIWEEGRRYAFYGTQVNAPLFKRFAEDYLVTPDGPAGCTFTWTIALEPTALGKPGGPVNALLFNSLFRDTSRYFGAS